jgi:hypothetical protein
MTLEEQKVFIDFGWSPILNSEARIVGWTRPSDCSDDLLLEMLNSVDKSELLLCELPCHIASTK